MIFILFNFTKAFESFVLGIYLVFVLLVFAQLPSFIYLQVYLRQRWLYVNKVILYCVYIIYIYIYIHTYIYTIIYTVFYMLIYILNKCWFSVYKQAVYAITKKIAYIIWTCEKKKTYLIANRWNKIPIFFDRMLMVWKFKKCYCFSCSPSETHVLIVGNIFLFKHEEDR